LLHSETSARPRPEDAVDGTRHGRFVDVGAILALGEALQVKHSDGEIELIVREKRTPAFPSAK